MKIKKALLVVLRLCISRDYRILRSLRVFDPGYCLSLQKNADAAELDPLWTYVRTDWCTAQPLDPHPLFDTVFYLHRYFPEGLQQNPFIHYLRSGWKLGYHPGPYFDPKVYGERSGWSVEDGNPLIHYIRHGQGLGLSPSLAFDYEYYFDRNPGLESVGNEIIKHYKLHGASRNKSPLPLFDPGFYRQQLDQEDINDPLAHFLTHADKLQCKPSEFFDPGVYMPNCAEQIKKQDAFLHYLTTGVHSRFHCHERVSALKEFPRISLLVPVYNPEPRVLRNCIRSVLYQVYPEWELCLVDDCSPREDVRELLEQWAARDTRIKVKFLPENCGISTATSAAAELATGKFLGFLDNDDELSADCLLEVAEAIVNQHADLVYTDEDLVGDDSSRLSIFRKPGFNETLLLSHNYITHFVCAARRLYDAVGGVDPRFDGAQDYDLMLKLSELSGKIVHIPKVLYHWRASETSTSINHSQKNYANEAGRAALEAAMERRDIPLGARNTELNFFYRLVSGYGKSAPAPQISVVIAVPDGRNVDLEWIIRAIDNSGCRDVEYLIVGPAADVVKKADFGEERNVRLLHSDGGEGHLLKIDQAARKARGEYLVLLRGPGDLTAGWLTELLAPLSLPDVALVCGRVTYSGKDGTSYLKPDVENSSALYLHNFLHSASRHMAGLHCLQDVQFASCDLCLMKASDYLFYGGVSGNYPQMFGALDFSLRLIQAGKRLVYTPYAGIDREVESAPLRGPETTDLQEEKTRFQKHLKDMKGYPGPFYSLGLLEDHGVSEPQFYRWLWGE